MQINICPGGQALSGVQLESERSLVRFPANTYIFILNFSLVACSSQLGGPHANEFKHNYL